MTFRVHVDSTFVRDELHFSVRTVDDDDHRPGRPLTEAAPNRWEALCSVLDETERPTIIYAPTRRLCDELAPLVAAHLGEPALAYHAGVEAEERRDRERHFLDGEVDVMVATNAFGMGVDKADVRSVIHWACPPTPEALYQEAGRAGRGAAGQPAKAILLYNATDLDDAYRLARRDTPTAGETRRADILLRELADHAGSQTVTVADHDLAAMANLRDRIEPRVVLANLERAGLVRELQRFTGARQYELIGETPDDATVVESLIVAMLSSSPGPHAVVVTDVMDSAEIGIGARDVHDALRALERAGVVRPVRQVSVACFDGSTELINRRRKDAQTLWRALETHHVENGARRYLFRTVDLLGDTDAAIGAIELLSSFGLVETNRDAELSGVVPGVRAALNPDLDRMRRAFDAALTLAEMLPNKRSTFELRDLAALAEMSEPVALDALTTLYLAGCASADLKRWTDPNVGFARRLQLIEAVDRDQALARAESVANDRARDALLRTEVLRRYAELEDVSGEDIHQAYLHRYLTEPDFMEAVADNSAEAALLDLTETQQAIVRAEANEDVVVVAGPGTGKTRTLVRRIAFRTRSGRVLPEQLLALTFTRSAAAELKLRLAQLDVRGVQVRTIDAVSFEVVRSNWRALGYRAEPVLLAQAREREQILRNLGYERPRNALQRLDRARASMPDDRGAGAMEIDTEELVTKYVQELRESNTIDFPQALLDATELLQDPQRAERLRDRFHEIIVDEFQDVSQPQVDFISALRGRYIPNRVVSHVTIVGDPRQTIFEWRGARPQVLLQKRASTRSQSFDLTENFRSGQKIVELANTIIKQVLPELPPIKSAITENGLAVRQSRKTPEEMLNAVGDRVQRWIDSGIPDSEIAVVAFRTNMVTDISRMLKRRGIASHEEGLLQLSRTAVFKDTVRLAENTSWDDELTIGEVVPQLEAAILAGDRTEADEEDWDRLAAELMLNQHLPTSELHPSLMALRARDDGPRSTAGVTVTTLHKSKGQEWDAVAVTDVEAGPGLDGSMYDEERCRLLYVGVTRARRALHVSYAGEPSRFLPA